MATFPYRGQEPYGPTLEVYIQQSIADAIAGLDTGSEVRSDTTSTYSYMGTAAPNTAESAGGWTIARITIADQTVKHASGAWSNRATLTYT